MIDSSSLYEQHGVEITNKQNGELIATCPFCGKERHFYIHRETGLYYCQRCNEKGNLYQFLQWKGMSRKEAKKVLKDSHLWVNESTHTGENKKMIFESCQRLIKEKSEKLIELAEVRRFRDKEKAVALMKEHNVCIDEVDNFIFTLYSADGSLLGLQRYNKNGVTSLKSGKMCTMNDEKGKPTTTAMMSGHKVGFFGHVDAINNPDIHTLIICEAPIKALHLQLQGFDGTSGILAVGLPGAGKLPKDQKEILRGRNIYFCYDYDFKNGNPGQKGVKTDARKIGSVDGVLGIKNIIPAPELIMKFKEKQYDKVDLADDYWLEGGTIEEFNKLMDDAKVVDPPKQKTETTPSFNKVNPYLIDGSGCLYKKTSNKSIKLSNFNAEIKEEIIKDNGIEQTYNYVITGRRNSNNLPQIEVPAETFTSMKWLHNWGTKVIIEPGHSVKDCVRHYIQLNSNAKKNICFTHTGWRQVDDEWIYLTGNGAIGADNVSVELSRELQKYNLPIGPFSKEKEKQSILAGLSFLGIGKKEITYPLYSLIHLAPLTTLLNQMPNFSVWLRGGTGLYKTTTANVSLSFFGDFWNISTLPNFSDTANSIERRAFTLKDSLMVLDDYHPSAHKTEALKTENTAERIIRAFSNRTGRGRLNADSSDKGRYEPRGMLLITGEDLVTVPSTLARVLVIEVENGGIFKEKLSEIQEKLSRLPYSMASYLAWVKDNIKDIKEMFPKRFIELRKRAQQRGIHNKLPEQVAYLTFSMETVLSWLTEKCVINDKEANEIIDKSWDVFVNLASLQSLRIRSEDPVGKFVDILQTLITQGKVKLEPKEKMTKFKNGENFELLGDDRGEMIGYFDDHYYYLLPAALWRTIQIFCRDEGSHFPFHKNTFYGMLRKQGLIKTKGTENTILIKVTGKVVRVLQLSRNATKEDGDLHFKESNIEKGNVSEIKSNVKVTV